MSDDAARGWFLSIAALSVTIVCCALMAFRRPPMPYEWRHFHSGMSRIAALAVVGSSATVADMREEKGFESVSTEMRMHGARAYWEVLLRYDHSERLVSAEAHFINCQCGLFNTGYRPLF